MLDPYKLKLIEWALTGKHDLFNLIDINTQVSNYIFINKDDNYKFVTYNSYIQELINNQPKKSYGIPLSWTYPSKQLGKRIQFKLPIMIN